MSRVVWDRVLLQQRTRLPEHFPSRRRVDLPKTALSPRTAATNKKVRERQVRDCLAAMKNQVVPPSWAQSGGDHFRLWCIGSQQPSPLQKKNRSVDDPLTVTIFSGLGFVLLDVFVIV